jgi:tetratricopeptide (TPR) repeat protein
VGLVTKAIDRVEETQPSSEQQGKSPPPRRKKKLLLAFTALLLIIISLGLVYMFLLKPSQEPPPKLTRRSLSARNRPSVPKTKPAEKTQPDQASASEEAKELKSPTAGVSKEETSSSKRTTPSQGTKKPDQMMIPHKPETETSQEATTGPVPKTKTTKEIKEAPLAESEAKPTPGPEEDSKIGEPPVKTAQISQQETETIESPEEVAEAVEKFQEFPQEEMPPTPSSQSRGDDVDEQPEISDESPAAPWEYLPLQPVIPANLEELKSQWKQTELAVKERSHSRAERYFKKGTTYHLQGELNQAIRSYQEALAFDPDHLSAHTNLATAYLQTGRFKEAEQELVYLYAQKPKDTKVIFNFGLLLYRTGELASAEIKLKKLLELEPHHLEANLLLANIYEEKGEMGQALEHCIKAYQVNSSEPRVLYRLGRAWDMVGDPAKAISYYRLFLSAHGEKEHQWTWAVRDRLNYLVSQKEER